MTTCLIDKYQLNLTHLRLELYELSEHHISRFTVHTVLQTLSPADSAPFAFEVVSFCLWLYVTLLIPVTLGARGFSCAVSGVWSCLYWPKQSEGRPDFRPPRARKTSVTQGKSLSGDSVRNCPVIMNCCHQSIVVPVSGIGIETCFISVYTFLSLLFVIFHDGFTELKPCTEQAEMPLRDQIVTQLGWW